MKTAAEIIELLSSMETLSDAELRMAIHDLNSSMIAIKQLELRYKESLDPFDPSRGKRIEQVEGHIALINQAVKHVLILLERAKRS